MKNPSPLVVLNTDRREVSVNGAVAHFAHREFEILKALANAGGKILTRSEILERAWGYAPDSGVESRTVDQHVSRARRKLRELGVDDAIITVNSSGYRTDCITLDKPEPVPSRTGTVKTIKRTFGKNPGSLLTLFVSDLLPTVEKGSNLTLA